VTMAGEGNHSVWDAPKCCPRSNVLQVRLSCPMVAPLAIEEPWACTFGGVLVPLAYDLETNTFSFNPNEACLAHLPDRLADHHTELHCHKDTK
jgi:hypothetical protein